MQRPDLSIIGKADKVSSSWSSLSINATMSQGEVFIVRGDNTKSGKGGHAWVCDGVRQISGIHYYAIKNDETVGWEIITKTPFTQMHLHYNWGYNGRFNGWFMRVDPPIGPSSDGEYHQYKDIEYIRIRN